MVAVLSLARLYILLFPSRQIKPWIAFIVPGVFSICSLLFSTILFGTESGYPIFDRTYAKCYMIPVPIAFGGVESLNKTINLEDITDWYIRTIIFFNTPLIVTFFLVSASFSVSLFLLSKSGKASVAIGSKAKQQREASKTVIIVTLIYIVCNIPFVAQISRIIYLFITESFTNVASKSMTVLQYVEYYYTRYPDNRFERQYLPVVIDMFTVSLNSALNPFVYFTRITHFRKNFKDLLRLDCIIPASTVVTNGAGATR